MEQVKILGLCCANWKDLNTAWLIQYALKAAEKFGKRLKEAITIKTEFIDLFDKDIKPCMNCQHHCLPNRGFPYKGTEMPRDSKCIIKGDYMEELFPKVAEADAFIFGSPTTNFTYNSKFRILMERFGLAIFACNLARKPAAAITTAFPARGGGQINCLYDMNACITALEMIAVPWAAGGAGISESQSSGPSSVYNKNKMQVKKHRLGQWTALIAGRRVAEFAVMIKLAKRELGKLYDDEFIQVYHPPHGEETWAWSKLNEEEENYMSSLYTDHK